MRLTAEQIAEIRMRVFLNEPLPADDAQALFLDWEELKGENEQLTGRHMALKERLAQQDRLLHLADTVEERLGLYREARDKSKGRS